MGEIKQLTIEDAPALQEISIETYTDTFGPYNTPENMQAYWLIPTLTFILSLSIIN